MGRVVVRLKSKRSLFYKKTVSASTTAGASVRLCLGDRTQLCGVPSFAISPSALASGRESWHNIRKLSLSWRITDVVRTWLTLLVLTLVGSFLSAQAADLTKIDRTIAKEPGYQSKPEYCLLVFGPEAKERVWLVIDGDVLYVDRNGNGDLTETGKKVEAVKIDEHCLFRAGSVKPGAREYPDLNVTRDRIGEGLAPLQPEHYQKLLRQNPQSYCYGVGLQVENPLSRGKPGGPDRMTQSASSDSRGFLHFAETPQEAPIVYFDGPWTMDFHNRPNLCTGDVIDLATGVGTKGLGTGTFAFIVHAL